MAEAGLYRRILPSPPAIEFASSDGKVSSFLLFPVVQLAFLLSS
jgi:hypothetical protein